MKILVTGAKGFVGKNLCATLYNIRDGKDRTRPSLTPNPSPNGEGSNTGIEEVFEYDIDTPPALLDEYCQKADFVFNLAGVNRPKEQCEFMEGNFGFASTLLDTLKKYQNTCPVMLSSSQQASLTGRFGNSEYGRSKKAGEDMFLRYEHEVLAPAVQGVEGSSVQEFKGSRFLDEPSGKAEQEFMGSKGLSPRVLVYRFPNLFGKWCRPNYNSAVATFCHNIAHDLPIQVNDSTVELELLYIDDLVAEMLDALEGKEHRCEFNGLDVLPNENGAYCYCPVTHKVTLGRIVELLYEFAGQPKTLMIPEIPAGSFAKKLYSTYLSYLPLEKVAFPLKMNIDDRGSFTELIHTLNNGQVSINISKPGITKGQHWHNTKWEFFIVVSGHALIQERKIGTEEIMAFEVSGDKIEAVHMLPGYTHNIINLSETDDLVTVMYCNEIFDPNKPDTFFEKV